MDEEPTIEVRVQLEVRDIARGNLAVRFNSKALIYLSIMAFFALLCVGLAWVEDGEIAWLALGLPVAVVTLWLSPYLAARRSWATNKSAREEAHYVFSERGVDSTAPSSSSHVGWDALYGATETGKDFLLFLSPKQTWQFPKRFFSPEQIQEFRGLLRANVKSSLKLKLR
ncbi:MAG TPA: YcxB family protein [Blastocatellia bacterium]